MKIRTLLLAAATMSAVACEGRVVQVGSTSPSTGSLEGSDSGAQDGEGGTSIGTTGDSGAPSIVSLITPSNGGTFTALTTDRVISGSQFQPNVYVAESVVDPATGEATAAATIWRYDADGTGRHTMMDGVAVGIPRALCPTDSTFLAWIDQTDNAGTLKSYASTGIVTIATAMVGPTVVSWGDYAFVDDSDLNCIVAIEDGVGYTPKCTPVGLSSVTQGGNAFHIVSDLMYAADDSSVYTINLQGNAPPIVTPLPVALNASVYDVAPGTDGSIYLATRAGVWKEDAAGAFSVIYGTSVVQQVEVSGTTAFVNAIDTGLVKIDLTSNAATPITSDIAIDTRFAVGLNTVFWIDAAHASVESVGF